MNKKETIDELEMKIELEFFNAMMGKYELEQEYPGIYYTNYLAAAFNVGRAMNLSENLILKYCCTQLSKILNNIQTERIRELVNSNTISIINIKD